MLYSYIETIRRLTGDPTVSLLIVSKGQVGSTPVVLLHAGKAMPVPELESEDKALAFSVAMDAAAGQPGQGTQEGLVRYYKSTAEDGYLLRVSLSGFAETIQSRRERDLSPGRRESTPRQTRNPADGTVWIGLRYGNRQPPTLLTDLRGNLEAFNFGVPVSPAHWLSWVLVSGAQMAWQISQLSSVRLDPTTRLPGRSEFQAHLKQTLVEATHVKRPLGLALINPDDFGLVNQRLDRESGDSALREIAQKIQTYLRRADAVFHYGSAIFAAIFWLADAREAHMAADRLRLVLSRQAFANSSVRLSFSVGVAVYEADKADEPQVDTVELVGRADRALNAAKATGGGNTVLWMPGGLTIDADNRDRLFGIFTADSKKDYRNMLLLWDTVQAVSSHVETEAIATEFVERLNSTFKPQRLGLFAETTDSRLRLLAATLGKPSARNKDMDKVEFQLSEEQRGLLTRVQQHRQTESVRLPPGASEEAQKALTAYGVPLVVRKNYLGCLYIDGPEDSFALDSSDLDFLSVLANQVAVALDRAELATRWKREQEIKSRRLREEVLGLRQALLHSRFVYQSSMMQSVLDVLRRVAPTDATVLITGESGTGKELLAHLLHEQSPRQKRAFVTVDCSVISPSLMEAELFGYKKGAYTGAGGSSLGRIAQAEGGTLLLDEIGEVPLDVQAKLLRFVQEKEITPVGAERSSRVDVRIVASTNRDLAAEVEAGRFRKDLYYRLQVVTITAPPLRERPDDILPLAHYFLEKFAVQYDKGVRRLDLQAVKALLGYRWPGNVRELQNRILQAVVMSSVEEIGWRELHLGAEGVGNPGEDNTPDPAVRQGAAAPDIPALTKSMTNNPRSARDDDPISIEPLEDPWEVLRRGLEWQVTLTLEHSNSAPLPLGRWLTEDLVLAADAATKGVARRASAALGMAETTFRRQVEKAKRQVQSGLLARTPSWSSLRPVLHYLVTSPNRTACQNIVEQARQILLAEVVTHLPQNDALGAALMGVTVPTYRRWTTKLRTRTQVTDSLYQCQCH